ncbi:chondroitin AC/alginate lyase [Mycena olivaceomarginata]|nr:chondroitin AC/alginate lyase [Mycena olivaceomarginata]
MPPRFTLLLFVPLFVCHWALATNPFTQYAVDFPDPNYVTAGQFGAKFGGAEATIVAWADEMASYGPWSVTNKSVVAPIRKLCNYVFRDGQVNPDRNTIQDSQSFSNLSDAVLYNSIAAMLQNKSSSVYSQNMAKFINTWFLDADTAMNPNLNYAQMNLGPGGQNGTYTGILDLRGFAKIASGILLLRKISNSDWTSDLDTQMIVWCNKYIDWLQTAPNAIVAAHATNNHGTIFVNQLAGLKLIVQDTAGAVNWTQGYFSGIFQGQVNSTGDQPQEASRTRPYHYRNFNIAGMTTNARLLTYADPTSKQWNATAHGVTIQKTVDFLMTIDPAASGEQAVVAEIYPNIAAIASVYGDPNGDYVKFLTATGFAYTDDPTFMWDQPLASGDPVSSPNNSSSGSSPEKNGDRAAAVSYTERCMY